MSPLTTPSLSPQRDIGPFAGTGVSVIIPAYEDKPLVRRAVWSVRATADLPYELIVSCARRCVAANRNAGLDRATQDLVAFLDDDVLLPAGWLSTLVSVLAERTDVGAVSAMFSFADGAPQTRRPELGPGELWDVTIPGTCFVYSRRRVDDLRFDDGYLGSQWEDTDWMWQVRERGLATVACGAVQAVHDHNLSHNAWTQHNAARFRRKWGRLPDPAEAFSISPEVFAAWRQPPLP